MWKQTNKKNATNIFGSYCFSYNLCVCEGDFLFCLLIDLIHKLKMDLEVHYYIPDSYSEIIYSYLYEVLYLSKYMFHFNKLKMRHFI